MYRYLYRYVLLPFFDGVVKGRQTLRYWRESEASQWWDRPRMAEHQLAALNRLLRHARQTCPYYAETWEQLGLSRQPLEALSDLQAWPLVTRELIREQRLRMRSTLEMPRITKATGGSSGEPLQFDLNTDSNDRRTAMMYRGYGWAGGEPGSKQLYVWGSHVGAVPTWKRWKTGLHQRFDRQLVLSCFEFTPDKMREHLGRWNRYRPEVVVAYTNPLYEFARFCEQAGLEPAAPRSILVGAEKLHDFQRETLTRVFRAPVFETYGSREFMLIGAECDQHAGLHLSEENLLVEILNDDGSPTPDGEEGNVVITDLYNYGMPFIRYVNGDRAVAGFGQCACGRGLRLLNKVVGRQLDVLDTPDGRKIPGEFFPHLLKDYPAIRRFQVVQEAKERIALKLVVDGGLTIADRERLLSAIQQCTGTAVEIQLQMVDDIPLTKAGKHRVVVHAV